MTWGEWGIDYSVPKVAEMIGACLDLGITSFDHADIYGHYSTEETFGRALTELGTSVRAQIELVTKCGIRLETSRRPENKLKSYDLSREYIVASAERSLKNFGTDYLDLFLLHRPSPLMNPAEIAEAFAHLQQSGKVRAFGVRLRLRDTVKTLADKYGGVGEDVILLAWLLKHPVGAIPVVGTTKKSRLAATRLALELDMEMQDWFAILEAAVGHEVA